MTRIAIRPVRTDEDYQHALKRVEQLIAARPGSPDGDELEIWATLVEAYERKRFVLTAPDAITAIKFRMEQQGLTRLDVESMIGARARVSEVLSGKRPLTLRMVRQLHAGLNIPADLLIVPAKKRLTRATMKDARRLDAVGATKTS